MKRMKNRKKCCYCSFEDGYTCMFYCDYHSKRFYKFNFIKFLGINFEKY